jgi:glycosyltransferase involved in cell wall biosynthesis
MIRVLHVYKSFGPKRFGGVEAFIENLVESTKPKCLHIILACGPVKSTTVVRHRGSIVVLVRPQFTGFSMPVAFTMFPIFWFLSRRVDVVHYHYPFPFQDILSFFAKSSLPKVVTYHSDIVGQRFTGYLYRPLMRLFLKRADAVVATSPVYKASSCVLQSLKKPPVVIPLAIKAEPAEFDQFRLAYWKQRLGSGFQLFLGAHRAYKGLSQLVESAARTKLQLVIAGEGLLTEKIVLQAQALGADNISFVGLVSRADQAALLFLSRVLVLPSCQRSEAFGIVLLEASRQSTPMITTEIGTATSWVNQHMCTGLVVPPNSQADLEEAMMFMHQSPNEAVKMGLLAKQRFDSMFDVTLMAQSYIRLYQSVISDKSPSHNTQSDKPKRRCHLLRGINK